MSTKTPIIETILENIETDLNNISKANSFRNDPAIVSRQLRGFDEINEFPALYIAAGNEEGKDLTNREIAEIHQIKIYGYVKFNEHGQDQDIAQTQLNNLISDVKEKLQEDRTRGVGGIATRIPLVEKDDGVFEPFAVFIMTVEVELDYQLSDTGTNLDP